MIMASGESPRNRIKPRYLANYAEKVSFANRLTISIIIRQLKQCDKWLLVSSHASRCYLRGTGVLHGV